ncbi:hypothetical protein ONS95_014425 [Cadophora gregata]|uniref:uncharacterized protein n=1 Tax=Cadophora gregata TaxID=51156 RepID=UPI0026DBC416|nr:uncharacterized protein ONS95_014425 [Cadophora gregata]KAK0112686.1 hypothetical protein ONS95_014425 [Cadophora gregata]KAK0124820.1 hypothetical protein ONS96_008701 [Cadophora gregata f. sp. sojae]
MAVAVNVNFFAMPSSSMVFLFSFAFSLTTNALPWTGAQQTNVYREAAWSPAPTAVPNVPANIFKRESLDVNVCGWVGGNSAVAAVCSSGSSCIHDTIHAVVGCCATEGPCTAGVYTSCVDKNSVGWSPNEGMQNNGIYSCSGDDVCYRNTYPGGYYQYGCGASQDATSVETTYEGQASDVLLQVVFTGVNFSPFSAVASTTSASSSSPTSSSQSTSVVSSSSSLSSTTSSASSFTSTSSSSLSSSKSQTSSGSSTLATAGKATPASESSSSSATVESETSKNSENKGAITGAVIGSVLGLAAIVGFALWWGRRRRNKRKAHRAGSFITQHNSGSPPTSGPFQRIAPYGPDDFGSMSQTRTITTVTANADGNANATGIFPTTYNNAYTSLPNQSSPPLTPPNLHATHPGSEPGTFQAMYLPPAIATTATATANTPLISTSEIDDFSRSYHDAFRQEQEQEQGQERDTHIHTGDLPSAVSGIGAAPMLLRGGSGGGRRRSQDWGVTTEALRAQRPRLASGPVPIKPAGWSPRGLSMRRSSGGGGGGVHSPPGSFSGTGNAGRGRGVGIGEEAEGGNEKENGNGGARGNRSPEWAVPPKSPLREERRRRGREDDDGVQRYQLVDEVVGDDVPILHSPGQLRMGRGRRVSNLEIKD